VEQIERPQRGTSITLHLRPEAEEFLNAWKIKQVIGKYSHHISLPILMEKEEWKDGENDQPGTMEKTGEWETINKASALWTRPKKDITAEQY
ncbi:molecular chaperone HtpG, partial [Klebsiella aerogenes]|nr:molecular chaperone HtpG [Klebsiella aerogenes]